MNENASQIQNNFTEMPLLYILKSCFYITYIVYIQKRRPIHWTTLILFLSLVKKGLPISQSKLLTSNAAKLKCQFPEILSFSNNYWKQFGAEQLKIKKNTVAYFQSRRIIVPSWTLNALIEFNKNEKRFGVNITFLLIHAYSTRPLYYPPF